MPKFSFKRLLNSEVSPTLPLDGEILYSKNNVCIHPPGLLSNSVLHHPGFLAITAQVKEEVVSLLLSWSPSSKLGHLGNGISSVKNNITKDVEDECSKHHNDNNIKSLKSDYEASDEGTDTTEEFGRLDTSFQTNTNDHEIEEPITKKCTAQKDINSESSNMLNTEEKTYKGYVIRPSRSQTFGAFTINLANMRSLRIYFQNNQSTNGQLIIASKETQYKVLHFHHGGLDYVTAVFKQWRTIVFQRKQSMQDLSINHFTEIFSNLTSKERHPEEGLYRGLTADTWSLCVDEFGRIQNEANIQKAIFFGGVAKELRPAVWPYLLKFYRFDLTVVERNELQLSKLKKYHSINAERERIMMPNTINEFWKNLVCSVEKDVLRTDRANPFFKGEGNPNLDTLQNILLNYSVYTKTGYTQGMSDLLSPLLIEIQEESNVFWCFVGLMQHTIFISSPSDQEMEKQLLYLRELLRFLLPEFYMHLISCGSSALELLFTHRWILLCFKREFSEEEALKIWEACWAHYQSNYFHLFVCVAIIALYGADVTEKKLSSDEMLQHFSHLALHMNGSLVLKKARGLLHNIRMSNNVPCTLFDLFCMLPSGGHDVPTIRCANTPQCDGGCPHGGNLVNVDVNKFKIKKLFN